MARPRTFDEDEVLRAVQEKFWDRGYAATSLSDIMQASGLGKGSIYASFGDKDAIFSRVFGIYCDRVTDAVREALGGPEDSAFERLRDFLATAATGSQGSVAQRACFLAKTTAELAAHRPDIAERSRRAFTDLAGAITRCVTQAQRAGDIDPEADPAQLGHYLLAVFRGLEALAESGFADRAMLDAVTVAMNTLASVRVTPRQDAELGAR